jgi:hypothetical protein
MNTELVVLFTSLQVCLAGALILIGNKPARQAILIDCSKRMDIARSRRRQPSNPDVPDF